MYNNRRNEYQYKLLQFLNMGQFSYAEIIFGWRKPYIWRNKEKMNQRVQTKNTNPLGFEKESKLLVRYAIPCIISMLVSALYNIVDQVFIGQGVGTLGNAATNVAFPLSIICIALALLFGIGGASLCSLKLGAGDKESAALSVGNSTFLMLISGVTLSVVVLVFLEPMLLFFGATQEVLPYAKAYTRITAIGFPFLIINSSFSKMIIADGSPNFSMASLLIGAIINTVLDAVFVLVLGMGIEGAAIATVIGQVVSCVFGLTYLGRFKQVKIDKSAFRLRLGICKQVLSLGISPCLNQVAMAIVQIVMNNTLRHYGGLSIYGSEIPLACVGIITKVSQVFNSVVIGIAQGQQPILGFNYGAKNFGRVKRTVTLSLKAASICSVIGFFCFMVFPRQIISLFGAGNELYFAFAVRYMRIFLFLTFINGIQPISANFFTSIGKPKLGMTTSMVRQIFLLLPLLLILPFFIGIDGVAYAGPLADLGAAIVCGVLLIREAKELTQKQEEVLCTEG